MKIIYTLVLLLLSTQVFSQTKIEWAEDYKITINDFEGKSPKTRESGAQNHYLAAGFDCGYAMSNYEFMLTKNFNKYVTASFNPNNSWMQEGEGTEFLLSYAQMEFDLVELYARKLRKLLFESKNALSTFDFYKAAYEQVQDEMVKQQVEMQDAALESPAKMMAFHQQIRKDISELSEFCKLCKPAKPKKK